jgi:hypothetical protein
VTAGAELLQHLLAIPLLPRVDEVLHKRPIPSTSKDRFIAVFRLFCRMFRRSQMGAPICPCALLSQTQSPDRAPSWIFDLSARVTAHVNQALALASGHGDAGPIIYLAHAISDGSQMISDCEGDEHDGREPEEAASRRSRRGIAGRP